MTGHDMVLEDLEDDYQPPRASFFSLILSLVLHAVLAFILWTLVYGISVPTSIRLTASLSTPSNSVTVKVSETIQPVDKIIVEGEEPAKSTNSTIDDLLLEALTERDLDNVDNTIQSEDIVDAPDPSPIVEFFGATAIGTQFVFVVDISYSMKARNGQRFGRAMEELVQAISNLTPDQSYYVYLFSWRTKMMYYDQSPKFIRAELGHEKKLQRWIKDISLNSGTDPRRALSLANNMHPDAIFLLSDGQFNHPATLSSETGWFLPDGTRSQLNVEDGIAKLIASIPVHTISFENPFTKDSMARIAKLSGGDFRYIKTNSHRPLDSQRFLNAVKEIEETHKKDSNPQSEYRRRLSIAREFIADGELVFAEYIVRPIRNASPSMIENPVLREILLNVLDEELGETRLENFENTGKVEQWLRKHSS